MLDLEDTLGIVSAKLGTQSVAALRDRANAAPFAVTHLEDILDQLFRRRVALLSDDPAVLVLHLGPAGFELLHATQDALEHIDRLEAGDDDRHLEPGGERDI